MHRTKVRTIIPMFIATAALGSAGVAHATKIQDLVRIKGHEENVITGLGLVIGLDGTGDKTKDSYIAARPMAKLLENLQNAPASLEELAAGDSFAVVLVTMTVPETGAREGDRFDVYVEAMFNAKSLKGGRLVPSMLRLPLPDSAELMPLGIAEGKVTIEDSESERGGVIRGGGQVLEDYAFRTNPIASDGTMTLVLKNAYAGYPVATTIAQQINDEYVPEGYPEIAYVQDARNIRVLIPEAERVNPANFIALIQMIQIDPSIINVPARVVVNERVGSIVILGSVEISPVAITHGGLTITFITPPPVPSPQNPEVETRTWATMDTTRGNTQDSARLDQLVAAFDQLAIPPQDQIAIIFQLQKAGALHAEVIRE